MNGERRTPTWDELLRERLGDDAGFFFERVSGRAGELIDRFRGDSDATEAMVEADIVSSLQRWFSGRATSDQEVPFAVVPGRSGAFGDDVAAAEWVFLGTHDVPYAFNSLPATGREVEVHGVSILSVDEEGNLKVSRHIDWAGLYAQLGLGLDWRVPLTPPYVIRLDEEEPDYSAPEEGA